MANMAKIIGVKFKDNGKVYYFDSKTYNIKQNDMVIVETARGIECGTVVFGVREASVEENSRPLKNVIRIATEDDKKQVAELRKKEKEAHGICNQKIEKHGLEMKLVDVEYAFDGSKILFCFTSEGRVDFRELVKDLASTFHARIELRQIGVRDEARTHGGLGVCGRNLCCVSYLEEFQPVSIKMAKEQNLSLNPTKISGCCGRLMCCLKYEQAAYEDLLKTTPRIGWSVGTPAGAGTVVSVALLKGIVKVKLDNGTENSIQEFKISELKILRKTKAGQDDPEKDEDTPVKKINNNGEK